MTDRANAYAGVPSWRRLGLRKTPVLAGAATAVALLIGVVLWLAVRDSGSSSTPVPERAAPAATSVADLTRLARGRPIYWAGPMPGVTYELTRTSDRRVYIRYLPAGVPIGTSRPQLSVGTYPVRNAFAVTSAAAKRRNSVKIDIGGAGVAFYELNRPTNVYLARKGSGVQVEVYDPSASRAHQLVSSGQVAAILPEDTSETTATATSPAKLKALAAALRRPVYWLGREKGATYELSRASSGRIYVRYLPRGTRVGARKPYLTVATYPVEDAFSVTLAASRTVGAVVIPLAGDGVAFYSKSRPANVYVAYRGVDYQIEVYDPSPSRVHELVAKRGVKPVG